MAGDVMAWNNRNNKERIKIGARRHSYKCRIAWAFVKSSEPDMALAIDQEAKRKFPIKPTAQLGVTTGLEVTAFTAKLIKRKNK